MPADRSDYVLDDFQPGRALNLVGMMRSEAAVSPNRARIDPLQWKWSGRLSATRVDTPHVVMSSFHQCEPIPRKINPGGARRGSSIDE
jgi:hypothetical protein